MSYIHPTAIVHKNAVIGEGSHIGPFCILGEKVSLGKNCVLKSHVVIEGKTTIGDNVTIFPHAVIGAVPQDLKYNNEDTEVIIGNNNTIRECVTINISTSYEEPTTVKDNCLLMAYVHVAHNCIINSNVILANSVNLAGHVVVDEYAILGGATAVHQFVHIGKYAFVGGKSGVKKDVPPFTRGEGMPFKTYGLNSVGLQRKGFDEDRILAIKRIYKHFYKKDYNTKQAIENLDVLGELNDDCKIFVDFIKNAQRGIVR